MQERIEVFDEVEGFVLTRAEGSLRFICPQFVNPGDEDLIGATISSLEVAKVVTKHHRRGYTSFKIVPKKRDYPLMDIAQIIRDALLRHVNSIERLLHEVTPQQPRSPMYS